MITNDRSLTFSTLSTRNLINVTRESEVELDQADIMSFGLFRLFRRRSYCRDVGNRFHLKSP
jgi:hypothetical protein